MANDESRLPKWAQSELQRLRADVEHWKKKAYEAANENPGDTDTLLCDMVNQDKGLPKGSNIKFVVNEHGENIHVYLRGNILHICGDTTILIKPMASNSIEIKLAR